ncbi:MAG: HDOD domain-containing protein [Leptothrix sp. (in: b-proteobacteria)]
MSPAPLSRVTHKYFGNAAALPTMPEIAHRLLRSVDDPDVGLRELSALIAQDQGLSVKLLRMANSARYSPRRKICTLQDAATTIGLNSLRDLSLAACVAGAFPKVDCFDRRRFWRQSLASASHARLLARACGVDADTAYLAGLVMRTGELLMLMVEPEAVAIAELRASAPDSLLGHEQALMQCHHLDVTAELARRWHFPAELIAGLAAAADPLATRPFSRLGAVLRLASVISDAGERDLPAVATLLDLHAELVAHMQLDLAWLADQLMPFDTLTSSVEPMLH